MRTSVRVDVGIIGGTGIGERLLAFGGEPLHVPTAAGVLRGRLVTIDGLSLFVVSRHSAGHKVPPHRVNYLAMAFGMKAVGAKGCLSTAAVGSLRQEWGPGTLVACSDFLDLTGRSLTIFDQTVVHRDFSDPFGMKTRNALLDAGRESGDEVQDGGVYLCSNGPRYETPREIELYRTMGADVVGMTAATEAILMREAEVDYACLAIVTNLAAGISPTPLDHQEVVDEMKRSGERAVNILVGAAKRVAGRA
jgi:5'-methylthioadenosine phosphorylase